MAANLIVDTNAAEVSVRYQDAPALVSTTAHKVMSRIGIKLHADLVRNKLRGGAIGVRTGTLSRSGFYRVELVGDNEIVLRVGMAIAKAKYARIHNEGGVITAKTAQKLAIPLEAALTGKGVARFTARQFMENPAAFGYDDAFVNRRGTVIFGVRLGATHADADELTPMFALKRSVAMKKRDITGQVIRDGMNMIRSEFGMLGDEVADDLGKT